MTITNSGSITVNNNAVFAANTVNNNIVRIFGMIQTGGANDHGVFLRDFADVFLSGIITTFGTGSEGIQVAVNGTVNVSSTGQIDTSGLNAEGIVAGTQSNISNAGSIVTSGNNQAHGIAVGTFSQVTNSGSITTTGSRATGNQAPNGIRAGDNANVFNSGSIVTSGTNVTNPGNSSHAIRVRDNGSVTNTGDINTSGADADGIFSRNDAVISNGGNINVTGTDANGIVAATRATISNSGRVFAERNGIVATANAEITNSGTIRALRNGIVATANSNIRNSGSIIADNIGINLTSGNGSKSVVNSGRIETTLPVTSSAATTGYALRFRNNNADDTLTLQAGSRIIGRMDMGNQGGNDTVILDRSGGDIAWRWTFEDYNPNGNDTLDVVGGPFVVDVIGDSLGNGATVTVGDTSLQTSAGAQLSDLSASQNKLALDRISEAWALDDGGANDAGIDQTRPQWHAWTRGYFALKNRDAAASNSGDMAESQHALSGVAAGIDRAMGDHVLLGAFASSTHSTYTFEGSGQTLTSDMITGGAYGRLQAMNGVFADFALTAGYINGDAGARLRANNLVVGGIEEIEGGEVDGAYVSPTLRFGAEIAVGSFKLMPTATIGYSAQWREGYSEIGDTVQSVDKHLVETTSGRLELAAVLEHNGSIARLHAGISAQKDISGTADFTLGSQSFDIDTAAAEAEFGTFAGFAFNWTMNNRWALNLDAEASLADIPNDLSSDTLDLVGVNAGAGLRLSF
ncbi:MAG: autotransporter domain-containing protein [Hyphomicrobiales bacterium]